MKERPVLRNQTDRGRLVALLVTAVMLAGLVPLASPGTAQAAVLDAPTLTSPASGATVTGNPVFAWTMVSGAAKYRIQISSSPSFTSPVAADTQNLRFAPPTELPLGTLYWRVAALDSKNVLGTYATGTFEKAWGASPEPISPPVSDPADPDGVVSLAFPTEPLLFTWKPLAGAQSYELVVDDADDFIGATTYKTKNTAYVITEPRTVGDTFYWQVRGVAGGIYSDWSEVGKFRSTWSTKPVLVYPGDNAVGITDVYFDWDPVLGAKTYQLQVSPNADGWTNNKIIDVTVKSTRYAPPVPLNNGNYFWRVRALDAASTANFGPWSDIEGVPGDERVFQRGWPDKPSLVWPPDGGSTADANAADPTWQNPTFTWTPARRASWYRVRVGTEKNAVTGLLDGDIQGCVTNRTTLTPNYSRTPGASPGTCGFSLLSGTTYYWDVAGIDSPVLNPSATDPWGPPDQKNNGVLGLRSDVHEFTWQPPAVLPGSIQPLVPEDYLTPAACAPQDSCTDYEADTPVLTWTAIPGAATTGSRLRSIPTSPTSTRRTAPPTTGSQPQTRGATTRPTRPTTGTSPRTSIARPHPQSTRPTGACSRSARCRSTEPPRSRTAPRRWARRRTTSSSAGTTTSTRTWAFPSLSRPSHRPRRRWSTGSRCRRSATSRPRSRRRP